ncbi:MAG TPA: 3-hydroxybutyryl-CoA dehydrogenase [Burkholderiaceae bacterium]|jgi:3-hydroxybutyryl-CoA dehydrogenase|nr:3-hydroxybutyryl-CoA dehydrogenase [Burkholderiaceae bacterium]HRA78136.1 3-hydroxybutyryl-CoA dehydrogenase [Burkholderiaceae bacterium]
MSAAGTARETIAALGAGRMGRGIATAFAYAGHAVWLVDVKPRPAEQADGLRQAALAEIDASLAAMARWGAFDDALRPAILRRVRFAARDEAPAALAGADAVFEGVPEVIEAKREALAFAAPHLRPDALLASTTSTFLVTELAAFAPRPQRFLNAHWLNPAHVVPLVELSAHSGTAPEAARALSGLLARIGKVPVSCAAAPGYIVPRLQSLIMNEAARMIEQGVASAEDIDRATRYGLGFRFANMGVVEFIDFGGNDILYYASRYLAQALGDPRYASPAIVDRHMREGRNGLRDGKGFYDFAGVDVDAYRSEALGRMLGMLAHLGLLRPPDPG